MKIIFLFILLALSACSDNIEKSPPISWATSDREVSSESQISTWVNLLASLSEKEFLISWKVRNIKDGTKVVIKKENQETGYDDILYATEIKDGIFSLTGIVSDIAVRNLHTVETWNIPFVLEPGNIQIILDPIGNKQMWNITGTRWNDIFDRSRKEIYAEMNVSNEKYENYERENTQRISQANEIKDIKEINRIEAERRTILKEWEDFFENYPMNNPDSFASLQIIEYLLQDRKRYGIDTIKTMFEGLNPEIKNTKRGKEIQEKLISKTP